MWFVVSSSLAVLMSWRSFGARSGLYPFAVVKQSTWLSACCCVFFTSAGVKVWEAVENDAMEEERRGVDLHRAAQEAVEDPHVPASRRTNWKNKLTK